MSVVAAAGKKPKKSRLTSFPEKPMEHARFEKAAGMSGKTSQIRQADLIQRLTGAEL